MCNGIWLWSVRVLMLHQGELYDHVVKINHTGKPISTIKNATSRQRLLFLCGRFYFKLFFPFTEQYKTFDKRMSHSIYLQQKLNQYMRLNDTNVRQVANCRYYATPQPRSSGKIEGYEYIEQVQPSRTEGSTKLFLQRHLNTL